MSASQAMRWKPDEDQILREHFKRFTDAELAALLPGRSSMAIHQRLRILRLYRAKWLPEHDARLREAYGKVRTRDLARELGHTPNAVKQRARKLGLYAGRGYTAEQVALVRELYLTHPAAEISRRLFGTGRAAKSVHALAFRLGLAKHPHWPPELFERIRALLAGEDLTDVEAAARLGITREQITHARKRLGIPRNEAAILKARRQGIQTQRKTLGVSTAGELRSWSYRQFAISRGWPDGLRFRAVQILEELAVAGRPLTRHEIAERIGVRETAATGQRGLLKSNDREGSYLANLVKRSLVILLPRAHRITGQGKGKSRHLYTLSPAAIDVVITRAQKKPEPSKPEPESNRETLGRKAKGRRGRAAVHR